MSGGGCRIYIGNLPKDCRERDVEREFKAFGRIRDILLKYGYGFIEYDDARDADDAVYDMDGRDFLGDRIIVELARGTRRERSRDRRRGSRAPWMDRYGPPTRTKYRVIVENLSTRVSWQDLKDLMRRAGEVCYADAHKDRKNEGVVEFASRRDMEKAIDKYDGHEMNGRAIKMIDESGRRSRSRSRRRSRSRSRRSRSKKRSRSRSKESRSKKSKRSRSKDRSRSKQRDGSKDSSRKMSKDRSRSKSKSKDRSKSKDKSKSKSKDRSRSQSKERSRSKSKEKSRSKSKERSRSQSKERSRSQSRERSRSQSRERSRSQSKERSRSKSRSEKADSRSRSREGSREGSAIQQNGISGSRSRSNSKDSANQDDRQDDE